MGGREGGNKGSDDVREGATGSGGREGGLREGGLRKGTTEDEMERGRDGARERGEGGEGGS